MLFSTLWAYHTSSKTTIGFTPFHLVHDVESILPIECQIPSLCLVVELIPNTSPLEEIFLLLEQINEELHADLQAIEAAKTWSKSYFDSHFHPCTFSEGDMVLVYDQPNNNLGKGKFKSMWYIPYVVFHCLNKGAYILAESDGQLLKNPCNGIYLERFYA